MKQLRLRGIPSPPALWGKFTQILKNVYGKASAPGIYDLLLHVGFVQIRGAATEFLPDQATQVRFPIPWCAGKDDRSWLLRRLEEGQDFLFGWVFKLDWLKSAAFGCPLDRLVVHIVVAGDRTILS